MNKLKTLLIVTLAIGLVTVFAGSALADDWYVDGSGTTGSDIAGDKANPYGKISAVLDNESDLSAGDNIYVDEGTYTEATGSGDVLVVDTAVNIIAKNWSNTTTSNGGGNDTAPGSTATVTIETADISSDALNSGVVEIEADGVTFEGTNMDTDATVENTFVLANGDSSTSGADVGYGVLVNTSTVGSATSVTLKDISVSGGTTTSSGTHGNIVRAGLYVTTGSTNAASGTVSNWTVGGFTDASEADAGIYLNDDGGTIDVDVTESLLGNSNSTVSIKLSGSASPADFTGTTISKNKIDFGAGGGTTGIELSGGLKQVTIERNYFVGDTGSPPSGIGIQVGDGSDNDVDNVTIQGNQMEEGLYGIKVDSTSTSDLNITQNYIAVDTGDTESSIYFADGVENAPSINYNTLHSGGNYALDVTGLSSYTVDATNNYWNADDLGTVTGKVSGTTYATIQPYLFAKDLSDVVVDSDYASGSGTDNDYLYKQSELAVSSSDPTTANRAIYGYNHFSAISGSQPDAANALTNLSPSSRSSHVTFHVEEATNGSYDGGGTISLDNDYVKLVSEAGRSTQLKGNVLVTADNVVIGETDKGFTLKSANTGFGSSYKSVIENTSGSFKLVDSKIKVTNTGTNAQKGIYYSAGALTVQGSDFMLYLGGNSNTTWGIMAANNGGNLTVTDSTFEGLGANTYGIKGDYRSSGIGNIDVTLTGNKFVSLAFGTQFVDSNSATISNNNYASIAGEALIMNTLSKNTTGTVSITSNEFTENNDGVVLVEDTNDNGYDWTTAATVNINENVFRNSDQAGSGYAVSTGDGAESNSMQGEGDITASVDATKNYWNASSGPYDPVDNSSGEGDRVDNDVTYDPYWTEVSDPKLSLWLEHPPVRSDESGSLSSISADSFYTHLYTLRLGGEVV